MRKFFANNRLDKKKSTNNPFVSWQTKYVLYNVSQTFNDKNIKEMYEPDKKHLYGWIQKRSLLFGNTYGFEKRIKASGILQQNLDALWDCLTDFIDNDIEIILKNFQDVEKVDKEYADKILNVFKDAKHYANGTFLGVRIIVERNGAATEIEWYLTQRSARMCASPLLEGPNPRTRFRWIVFLLRDDRTNPSGRVNEVPEKWRWGSWPTTSRKERRHSQWR